MKIFEELFLQNPIGIIIWDQTGEVKYTNQKFLELIAYEESPKSIKVLAKEESNQKESEILGILHLSPKKYKTYTKEFLKKSREVVLLDVMTSLVRIEDEIYYYSQVRLHKNKSNLSKAETLKKQNEVLLKLTKSETIDSGDLVASVREITEAATSALACQRSSVWFYTEENKSILSMDLFQLEDGTHSEGAELFAKDFPAYFKYLSEERVLGADNAHTDPSTFEFSEVYLKPLNIQSMLDAPIRLHGKMVGVICNETVGNFRKWTDEELNFSASLADLISRAIEAQIRKKAEDEIKLINENLEHKVEEQTKEIRESLNQITKLKEFQDGDYFLTSLILNPLIGNKNKSEFILTDFIIKQKKQFLFRKSSGQIGGDYCITDNLIFQDEKNRYVFFLNADAMGKSMQGASGAIVIGTAILNILWQAKNSGIVNVSASEWLINTALELNNIYLTFEGSMILSACFGLIGEANRDLLFLNFEHPHVILLRDGKANFLEINNPNPKLGLLQLNKIPLESKFLHSNDTLIIGSDGKDDIELSSNQESRKINEDEKMILGLVEKSNGNIVELAKLVEEKGVL
ncbi:MAG TPA: SpoIIE family protein phosphatase, partial [Leptospiraceae bacterium]|nr:SpoIIE family protein phosphatase [Leptospiraceae bacterium]